MSAILSPQANSFDDEEFAGYYNPEKTFIIDYSDGATNPFYRNFRMRVAKLLLLQIQNRIFSML